MGAQPHPASLAGSYLCLPSDMVRPRDGIVRCAVPNSGPGPLQIVRLGAEGSSGVEVIDENLDSVCQGLSRSGADAVSIIAAVGAYRTGKSFLLDLLMRYSRALAAAQGMRAAEENISGNGEFSCVKHGREHIFTAPPGSTTAGAMPWRLGEQHRVRKADGIGLPAWVLEGDAERISEGQSSGSREGFAWRPGPERCTEGIWLWSTPLVVPTSDGRRVAILLMDTQGAWDDTLTKHQSATLFGLTALLSSRLVYNVQNNIQEDKLESLDYFMAFAHAACEGLPDHLGHLGHLDILVRDWANYEDGSSPAKCRAAIHEHLLEHLEAEGVSSEARARAARLRHIFQSVGCFGLVHPGLLATKSGFRGDLADVDHDFFHLLDEYAAGIFGSCGDLPGTRIGVASRLPARELRVRNFGDTVRQFAGVFRDAEATAVSLRDAFVRIEVHEAREELVDAFLAELKRVAPEGVTLDPTVFSGLAAAARQTSCSDFAARLGPFHLAQDEERSYSSEFRDAVNDVLQTRVAANDKAFEGAALKFVASPVFVVAAAASALHPALLATAPLATMGGCALSVRWWSRHWGLAPLHPVVLQHALGDAQGFVERRCSDLQEIRVVASHLGPTGCVEMMLSSARQFAGFSEVSSRPVRGGRPSLRHGGSPLALSGAEERRLTSRALTI